MPRASRRVFASDAAWAASVALAAAAVFALVELARPGYFLWDDNATFFLPLYAHDWRSVVEHGALPHLNFHQYLGQIHLGNGQSAVLYPPVYLASWLALAVGGDLRYTMDILAVAHLAVAAAGMAWLAHRWGAGRGMAFGVGLLWVTFPFTCQVARSWIVVAYAAADLPWSLLLLERLLRRPSASRILAFAAVKAFILLQGHAHYWVLGLLLDGAYCLARWSTDAGLRGFGWRRPSALAGSLGASVALAAPQLLPMLDAKGLSAYRTGSLSREEFMSNALEMTTFLGAQIFRFRDAAVHQASSLIFYVGLPVLAAAAALASSGLRRRIRSPPFVAAALCSLLALAISTRAWGLVYGLPLLSSFRWPFKAFLLFLFFTTLAASGTLAALATMGGRRRWLAWAALALVLAGNGTFLAGERSDTPFGPYRLPLAVGELEAEVRRMLPPDTGRVVSLWMTFLEAADPRLLAFNYAGLARAYHLGGYDPIIADENLRLAARLEYSNVFRYELTEEALEHLSGWSVRYLVTPARERTARLLETRPTLRLAFRGDGLEVYENSRALPFVSFVEPRLAPVPFEWGVNEVRILPGGRAGRVRVNVAPLPGYRVWIDGEPKGPPALDDGRHPVIEVPGGAREVVLRYAAIPFRLGLAVAAGFLLSVAAVAGARAWGGALRPSGQARGGSPASR